MPGAMAKTVFTVSFVLATVTVVSILLSISSLDSCMVFSLQVKLRPHHRAAHSENHTRVAGSCEDSKVTRLPGFKGPRLALLQRWWLRQGSAGLCSHRCAESPVGSQRALACAPLHQGLRIPGPMWSHPGHLCHQAAGSSLTPWQEPQGDRFYPALRVPREFIRDWHLAVPSGGCCASRLATCGSLLPRGRAQGAWQQLTGGLTVAQCPTFVCPQGPGVHSGQQRENCTPCPLVTREVKLDIARTFFSTSHLGYEINEA